MSTIKATNLQHGSAASPAIVLAADGTATATVSAINNGPLAGFRNALINPNFDFWQRGTSHTTDGYGSADRWQMTRTGTTCTMSRQDFTLGQTDVPYEPKHFCRMAVTSVAGAANRTILAQLIEGVRTFAGQQVTVSFWAKADATKTIALEFVQMFGATGSPSASVEGIGVVKKTLTTAWQKITHTVTIPSISGKTLGSAGNDRLTFHVWMDAGSNYNARTDTLGQQSGTFDFAQFQIEPGPVATPFERRPNTVELALCQRYYQIGTATFWSYASAGSQAMGSSFSFPTTMIAAPTVTLSGTGATNISAVDVISVFSDGNGFSARGVSSAAGSNYWQRTYTAELELG